MSQGGLEQKLVSVGFLTPSSSVCLSLRPLGSFSMILVLHASPSANPAVTMHFISHVARAQHLPAVSAQDTEPGMGKRRLGPHNAGRTPPPPHSANKSFISVII